MDGYDSILLNGDIREDDWGLGTKNKVSIMIELMTDKEKIELVNKIIIQSIRNIKLEVLEI